MGFGGVIGRPRLTPADIERIASREIDTAIAHYETHVAPDALTAQEYYNGTMRDLPWMDGRSRFVSRDVRDAVGLIMPGLMRIFGGSSDVVRCEPQKQNDAPSAKQATLYLNYLWRSRLNGYQIIWTLAHDALLYRNGVAKVWWDETQEVEAGQASGLTDQMLAVLSTDEDVAITGHAAEMTPMGVLHAVTFKRIKSRGKLCVEPVPPEEFLISPEAKSIATARFVGHRRQVTRSDLVEMGYDPAIVDDAPAYGSLATDSLADERREEGSLQTFSVGSDEAASKELELVEFTEGYLRLDVDGDGIAERIKVCMAGGSGSMKMLAEPEEVEDEPPFESVRALIRPHAWEGVSIADEMMEIQRGKSALWRATLDSLWLTVNPQKEVVASQIVDPDEVVSQAIGQIVRVKTQGSVTPLVMPFVGDPAINLIGMMDQVGQTRTGVSRATSALDGEALKPETAMAASIRSDAAYARTELIARNIADGLRRLFVKMLKITVANHNWKETIRLADEAVEVDPRSWNADMDVTVEVGLGTGSRERDLMMLMQVGTQQDAVIAAMGADNPIVPPSKWVYTRHKMVEAAGGVKPEEFFANVPDQMMQQFLQQKAEAAAANDPTTKLLEIEREKSQLAVAKAQFEAQRREVEAVAKNEAGAAELAARTQAEDRARTLDAELERMKIEAQAELDRMKIASAADLEKYKADLKVQMEIEVAGIRANVEREKARMAAEAKPEVPASA